MSVQSSLSLTKWWQLPSVFTCLFLISGATSAEKWPSASAFEMGMDAERLSQARDYALTGDGSGVIIRRGHVVMRWGDQQRKYDLKSTSKSIGITALGLAIADGKIGLDDLAKKHHPSIGVPPDSNAESGWLDELTIGHLATQTAGFAKQGGYQPLLFRPGTQWHYSDCGPNWLAECVTLAYRRDLEDLLFERVFTPIGITSSDLHWRQNAYRPHQIEGIDRREFGSGVHANVNAMARIGLLYLQNGKWSQRQLIPASFVAAVSRPDADTIGLPVHERETSSRKQGTSEFGNAAKHYGLLWWNNGDGILKHVPKDAYWSWGLYDSLILVCPSLDLVVARAGKSWKRSKDAEHYDVLKPFLSPICNSMLKPHTKNSGSDWESPYPPSQIIKRVDWAAAETIIRKAEGSDNWPITWGDDGNLYTTYGDGWGFKPRVENKLSMGFAKIVGGPKQFRGINIRSHAEEVGQGKDGRKASGILMINGTLYLWTRNVGNSQLMSSDDLGTTWNITDWKFTESFGCPTFLNFGKGYKGARDRFVYIYSHDSDSAYSSADRMVLARVPKDRLLDRDAYKFFCGFDHDSSPLWSTDINRRGPVFRNSENCYRSGITYNNALRRYFWCQTLPRSTDSRGPRFQGGIGIYDAPEPWGPWTTVFFTKNWDVGPGESSSIPTKWISDDGTTIHLVSSGDDCFSVRRGTLILRGN